MLAGLEQRINGIKEAFQEKITHFQQRRNEAVDTLQSYALRNHPQLFKRKKSYDFACGTISFRETPPKVIKTTKKTWKELLGTIKSLCPELIRSKEEDLTNAP